MKSASLKGPWAFFEKRNEEQQAKIQDLEAEVSGLHIPMGN